MYAMFYTLRINYYLSQYFKELKAAAHSPFETERDFVLKMGSKNLTKAFELTQKVQFKRYNQATLTYEQFLYELYKSHHEFKSWIVNKYGSKTYSLFLRAGDLDEKVFEGSSNNKQKDDINHDEYAKEIQKHLLNLGCTFTTAGYVSAMALKHDRSTLDQAISFCISAIAENYIQLEDLARSTMEGNIYLMTTTNKVKNYYENGQISKQAYQSVISIPSTCLNNNKTSKDKKIRILIKQNYRQRKLVSIKIG